MDEEDHFLGRNPARFLPIRARRRGETVTPLHWSDPSHRSLGHLVPDFVVTRSSSVWIVDAKVQISLRRDR
jgi:hypothetical protein